MADTWEDDDDDWDIDDAELDAKFSQFDDEKDMTLEEEKKQKASEKAELKKKGNALAAKKQAELERKEEMEIARKAMELEAEMESKMSIDERRALERKRVEEADNALTDDLFGGGMDGGQGKAARTAQQANDKVVLKTLADHMKYARKVSRSLKDSGKIHMATSFFVEALQQSNDVLDDRAISEIIKTCNVIKNEKVQAAKRKVKGQAQKSKKADKAATARAKKIQDEVFGDSNKYDDIDEIGAAYEDEYDFF